MTRKFFAGWWQVVVCLLLQAVSAATISSAFSVVAIPIGEAFDVSRMMVMFAMTALALSTGLLSPMLGTLMDRYSVKHLMSVGALSLFVGFIAISFCTSIYQVIAIYGLLLAPANVLLGPLASSVLLSRWFTKKRGKALALAAVGISLGGFFFPPFIQWMIDAFEWRAAFRYIAGISLLLTLPAILLVIINHPADKGLYADGEGGEAESTARIASQLAALPTRRIFLDPTFLFIAFAFGAVLFGLKGVMTNLVPLAIDVGTRPDMAALLISAISLGSFTGKLLFAALADRFDTRMVLMVGVVAFTFGLGCYWQAEDSYWVLVTGSIIFGLSAGGVMPLQAMMIAQSFGQLNVGRVMGLMTFAFLPLNLLTPPLFGFIHDRTGSYDLAMIIFICLCLAAAVLVPRIRTQVLAEPEPAPVAS